MSRTLTHWFVALAARLAISILIGSLSVAAGPLSGSGTAWAQDATPGQEEYAEPTVIATEAAPPVATDPPPVEASVPPTEEATSPAPPEHEMDSPSEAPASTPSGDAESDSATGSEQGDTPPPVPTQHLAFNSVPSVTCETGTETARIEHGGWLEYACQATVELSAENLPSLDAELHWVVLAQATGDWRVQFAPLPEEREWTPATQTAEIGLTAPFQREGEEGSWLARAEIEFRMRIHRARCDISPGLVDLSGSVEIAVPGNDEISFDVDQTEREPLRITAPLASIPVPSATFDGPVSFDPIGLTAVDDAVAGGSAQVIVSGLDRGCAEWRLDMQATSEHPGASFWLVSINGVALNEACPLADGCVLDLITGGADQPAETVYTIGLQLIVFSGVPPGSLPVSFNVALVPA
jgi:hypothetical protein